MKRLYVLLSILVPVTVALIFKPYLKTMLPTSLQKNQKTVADRLQEYGSQAHARLKPFFEAKQVAYPPGRITLVGLKAEKILEVYAGGTNQNLRFIRSYPIMAASGVVGPKLREGDQQVPEGVYPVEWLNPNSSYHLSFRIGYPNEFDREQARREGRTKLGGDIMIHGDAVSIGCLAMGDEAAEDLFVLAADTGIANITVILSPVDFRKGKELPLPATLPAWTGPLYEVIKTRLQELPLENNK